MKSFYNRLKMPNQPRPLALICVILLFVCHSVTSFAFIPVKPLVLNNDSGLDKTVTGRVVDNQNSPLPGVSVRVKGGTQGTVTNENGEFQLAVPDDNAVLVFSFVGYTSQEISVENRNVLNVTLQDDLSTLDEVIVTGVFDKRTRMESSVAISVLDAKTIEVQAPQSASDLLRNVPGVFVNNSQGEIRNSVSTRGFSGVNGYYYVSMQEEGLPVTGASYTNYTPDYFLRTDLTLGKLEAVRGGTASILGNNAPGGIFNYVSKTGGNEFEGAVRAKYGLEGDGKNPYYRVDANFGGALSNSKNIFYNIGGFWRQNDGPRYTGYPLNNGGQLKANIVKKSERGTIKLYGKYLNDRNNFLDFLPSVDFVNPRLASGVNLNTSFMVPAISATYYLNESNDLQTYDSRDKVHSKEASIGLNLDYDLGKGWTIDNKIRVSNKSSFWNTTQVPFPSAVDDVVFYFLNGLAGKFGLYTFSDAETGNQLLQVVQGANIVNGAFAGLKFDAISGSLPGESIQKNSLIFNPLVVFDNQVTETVEQLTLNKKVKNMNFVGGLYYVNSNIDRTSSGAGTAYSQMTETYPRPTLITYTDPTGKVFQVTNSDGVIGGSNKSNAASIFDVKYNQIAAFLGHYWNIGSKINFDWGIRFENIRVSGENQIGTVVNLTDGGADKNEATLYDNTGGAITSSYQYDKTVKTTSFSSGLNYKINDNMAIYGRYSLGRKAPDVSIYLNVNTAANSDFLNPIAQTTQQIEMGFKYKDYKKSLYVTPFYGVLGNIPVQAYGQETGDLNSGYSTPVLFNRNTSTGIEAELNYSFTKNFGIRAVGTYIQVVPKDNFIWNLGANGSADDTYENKPGFKNNSSAIRISPNYTSDKLFGSIDWTYTSKRYANSTQAWVIPAYSQSHLNVGYNLNSHLSLLANVNNLFNKYGVTDWAAPGGFPAALNNEAVTKASIEANPNAIYSTIAIQPRAYFLTATYRF